jgi:hypothetical protein
VRAILTVPLLLVLASACAPTAAATRVDETYTHPDLPPLSPFDACTVYTAREPAVARDHRTPCSEIDYPLLPPAGGPHYSVWANFLVYDAPVPWGFLVHSLEHGAVILAYDSDRVEAAMVRETFIAIANAHGLDPVCREEEWPNRIIVVPDPDLEWPIAVRAWEHVYDATCLDRPGIEAFIAANYAHAPEDFCFPGTDLSTTGWCP